MHLIDPIELAQVTAHAKPTSELELSQVGPGGVLMYDGVMTTDSTVAMPVAVWGKSTDAPLRHRNGAYHVYGATAVAVTCVEVLVLSQRSVRKRIEKDLYEAFRARIQRFPVGGALLALLKSRKKWKLWKSKFVKDTLRVSSSFKARGVLRNILNPPPERCIQDGRAERAIRQARLWPRALTSSLLREKLRVMHRISDRTR